MMRTIVCVKQVPASNEVRLDPKTNTIIRDGAQAVINPFDSHALEAALQLKERFGGTVTVLSMGIPDTERLLRECIARGADRALLLSYQAMCANSPAAAIQLQEQAVALLTNITADNALLASNLHANLGGMYRESGNYIKAREHMEAAITLLRQYDLLAYHDNIPQVVNYAMLLAEMGQPDKALTVLEQVAILVKEHNSSVCMDSAAIHETMGNTYLMAGNMEQAAIQHRKCLAIYAELFPDQPNLLAAKQGDLRVLYEQLGAYLTSAVSRIA